MSMSRKYTKCQIDGCTMAGTINKSNGNHHFRRGWCNSHYESNRKYGSPFKIDEIKAKRESRSSNCLIEGCKNSFVSSRRGYCMVHYKDVKKSYTVKEAAAPRPAIIESDIAKIPLGIDAKDGYVIVDKEFVHLSHSKWNLGSGGYAVIANSTRERMHRIILGTIGTEWYCDHIDGDRLNNRINNLRKVTSSQNMMNVKPRSANGYKGVSYIKQTPNAVKVWRAYIKPNGGKQISLKLHETPEEAARAYDKAAIKYFGEYAYLNFPN